MGFCRAELGAQARERLADFLAAGQHGDMGWLAHRAGSGRTRSRCGREARSVIALGLSYAPDGDPLAASRSPRGAISVYARNRDYHDVIKGMLKHLAQFIVSRFGGGVKVFVDTAPLMEKPLAEPPARLAGQAHQSGLARDRLLAVPGRAAGPRSTSRRRADARPLRRLHALSRRLPDRRLPRALQLDARRCISYLTIEHSGPIPYELRAADRQPRLRLRRLPGGLPLEQVRQGTAGGEAARRPELARAAARRTRGARKTRPSAPVRGLADQAHRPRPFRAQRADRHRQFR